jgi:hypothetical protein
MLIQLPGGTAIESDGTIVSAEENGEVRSHTDQALGRLVERWKKPALQALVRSYTDELQEVESMLWDVILLRFPDYASGAQLDVLGRIVGEPRRGKGDAAFRARIKAQIRINSSFGRLSDIIAVLNLADPASYTIEELGPAFFRVVYLEPAVSAAVQGEIPAMVAATRAAGVGASVTQPVVPTDGFGPFTFSDSGGDPAADGPGFSDSGGDPAAEGGSLSWYSSA